MKNNNEIVVGFESVSTAIMAEQALVKQAFDVRVMPMPTSITAGCGFCLRFLEDDIERAVAFLRERGIIDIKEAWVKSADTGKYKKIMMKDEG